MTEFFEGITFYIMKEGINLYVKPLSENEKAALKQRSNRIKELQEKGICFG